MARQVMRVVPAFAGAVLITLAIFLFMQSLIHLGGQEDLRVAVYQDVQIYRQERPDQEPETREDQAEAPPDEPETDFIEPLSISPPVPAPAASPEVPALDLAVGDLEVQAVGSRWSAPLSSSAISVGGGGGRDAQGYVEVVPYNTRRPNVPEVAWRNKISGWVLVAFTVDKQGRTRNVRVLDARPRGVFEEKVIAAVQDWGYRVSFSGKSAGSVVLTQKVEIRWEDYPQNLPNVD